MCQLVPLLFPHPWDHLCAQRSGHHLLSDHPVEVRPGAFLGEHVGKTKNDWLVVWNIFYFPIYWVANHPNWLIIFFRGVAQPPTRRSWTNYWSCLTHWCVSRRELRNDLQEPRKHLLTIIPYHPIPHSLLSTNELRNNKKHPPNHYHQVVCLPFPNGWFIVVLLTLKGVP